MKNYKEKKLYILHDVFLLLTVAVFLFLCVCFSFLPSLYFIVSTLFDIKKACLCNMGMLLKKLQKTQSNTKDCPSLWSLQIEKENNFTECDNVQKNYHPNIMCVRQLNAIFFYTSWLFIREGLIRKISIQFRCQCPQFDFKAPILLTA